MVLPSADWVAGLVSVAVSVLAPLRMLLSAAYFLALYLIGKHTGLNLYALLIGGALGLTILLALFTRRLARELEGRGKE